MICKCDGNPFESVKSFLGGRDLSEQQSEAHQLMEKLRDGNPETLFPLGSMKLKQDRPDRQICSGYLGGRNIYAP